MSVAELANEPIDITLAGKKFKIKRLTIKELFAIPEAKVKENYIKSAQEIAASLVGKDKQDFLLNALKNTPKGDELNTLAIEYMSSPVGVADVIYIGLNKCQPVSDIEVSELITKSTESELSFLRDYIGGNEAIEEQKKT